MKDYELLVEEEVQFIKEKINILIENGDSLHSKEIISLSEDLDRFILLKQIYCHELPIK